MTVPTASLVALRFDDDTLWALDQTELPGREVELPLRSAEQVADAIRRLAIRGAPLIGVAAAYGVAVELGHNPGAGALERACAVLRAARPTAVNLAWAVDRVHDAVAAVEPAEQPAAALAQARAIDEQETAASAAMATHGADLLSGVSRVITHCNTGALAAPGNGTALAVVVELAHRGQIENVLVNESRPLLQGARLTVYELSRLGIPHQLVVDSAAGGLIAAGEAQAVILGGDRIAASGDLANKVGTYPLALAARAAGIEFVVVAPTSTIDAGTPTGAQIEIEERDADEVRHAGGQLLTIDGTPCRNPAFDVTPADLLTALVTERGVARPVTPESVGALLTH
jgi:methylthioribose-1-phosphate isomerase